MSVVNADNQRLIAAAVAELFGTGDVEAMAPLLREGFVDHRPGVVASSNAGWLAAARKVPLASMQLAVRLVRWPTARRCPCCRRRWLRWQGYWIAVVDSWWFQDGLLAGHGGVLQPIPGDRPPTQRRWAGAVVTVGERLRGTRP
jgi:hypothetical protein